MAPLVLILLALSVTTQTLAAQTPPQSNGNPPNGNPTAASTFARTLRPFLEQNCQKCHNGKLRSGDVNFEVLKFATSAATAPVTWETTVDVLNKAQMPPPGNPQPPQDQVEAMVTLLGTELAKFKEVKKELVQPPTRGWLTWQGDTERTGWARAETTLTRANVANLALRWKVPA